MHAVTHRRSISRCHRKSNDGHSSREHVFVSKPPGGTCSMRHSFEGRRLFDSDQNVRGNKNALKL